MKKHAVWFSVFALAIAIGLPATAGEGADDDRKVKVRTFKVQNGEPANLFFAPDGPFELTRLLGKGFIGVGLTDLTPELRAHFAESEDAGVLINKVTEGSPAERAGLRVGDVVTAIDGEPVGNAREFGRQIRGHEPDEQVTLELFRKGRRQLLDVTIAERERSTVDLGDHLFWTQKEGGEPWVLEMDSEGLQRFPHDLMDAEKMKTLGKALEGLDWESMATDFTTPNQELEIRLEELEKRIEKMVEEMARKLEERDKP